MAFLSFLAKVKNHWEITQLKFAFEYKYIVEGSTFGLSLQLKCHM